MVAIHHCEHSIEGFEAFHRAKLSSRRYFCLPTDITLEYCKLVLFHLISVWCLFLSASVSASLSLSANKVIILICNTCSTVRIPLLPQWFPQNHLLRLRVNFAFFSINNLVSHVDHPFFRSILRHKPFQPTIQLQIDIILTFVKLCVQFRSYYADQSQLTFLGRAEFTTRSITQEFSVTSWSCFDVYSLSQN